MYQLLIYSDSLSWGIIPDTRARLAFNDRWPGVLEFALQKDGIDVRVIENCLNGRRTVWADPFKNGRDGSVGLAETVEMHSPLAIVILMLGTNDFQCTHDNNAWLSAQGMTKLIQIVNNAQIEPSMPRPRILVVAPPVIHQPMGAIAYKFEGAQKRCVGLPEQLKKISEEHGVMFFDSNDVTVASKVDGIHLDKDQHQLLGLAIASKIKSENCFKPV